MIRAGLPTFRPEPENRIDDRIGLLAIVDVSGRGSSVDPNRLCSTHDKLERHKEESNWNAVRQ